MRLFSPDKEAAKGWFCGPWNSGVPVPIGYANEGIDLVHYHEKMYEIYLVAQGQSVIMIDDVEITLNAGDALVVEPNEVHTFISSSDDYLHFVVHAPFVKGDKVVVYHSGRSPK
ncbi:MAG: cupin domain-containing protein [Chloroflexota bacterium]